MVALKLVQPMKEPSSLNGKPTIGPSLKATCHAFSSIQLAISFCFSAGTPFGDKISLV